jgi:hypothetical protein
LFNWNGLFQLCLLRSDLPNGASSFIDVPAALVGAKDCTKIEIIWPEIFPAYDPDRVRPFEPSSSSTTTTMTTTTTTTITTTATTVTTTSATTTTTEPSTIIFTAEGNYSGDSEPKTDRSVYSRSLH